MHEEAPGAYRLQPLQRARHPIDVGQRFAFDQERCAGRPMRRRISASARPSSSVADIERDFVDIRGLIDFEDGQRKAVVLEGGSSAA